MSCLPLILENALLSLPSGDACGLDLSVCKELLNGRDSGEDQRQLECPSLMGYPESHCKRIAQNLEYWISQKKCPIEALPEVYLINEVRDDERKKRIQDVEKLLVKNDSGKWMAFSDDEKKEVLINILCLLGLRGILDLLGLRNTAGSTCLVPPSRKALLESFQKRHSPKAKLSVGARALSKHCHRDQSNQWWGKCTGSEETKNSYALAVAEKILNNAVWINIHTMVHDTQVLEVRNEEGYGLRWACKHLEFRGFLEPQMKDGHVVGWRH